MVHRKLDSRPRKQEAHSKGLGTVDSDFWVLKVTAWNKAMKKGNLRAGTLPYYQHYLRNMGNVSNHNLSSSQPITSWCLPSLAFISPWDLNLLGLAFETGGPEGTAKLEGHWLWPDCGPLFGQYGNHYRKFGRPQRGICQGNLISFLRESRHRETAISHQWGALWSGLCRETK